MKETWGADRIEAQLQAAKDDLRGLEKNIRKILGRDVTDAENAQLNNNARIPQKRPLQEDRRRQPAEFSNNGFAAKRRWSGGTNNAEPKTVFSRLSARVPSTADDSADEDDNAFKPAVSSRVIATPRELPSRQDVIRRESTDERSRQRNRRMFGALLGTLQKFRQEETKLKAKEDKKAEVEARVEEANQKEREELKRERQQLFLNRKQQIAQVKALENKLFRSRQYQEWRAAQIPLLNFIKTKTQPCIYYLPKRSTPETDTLLHESSKALKAEIDRRERILLEDLEGIQQRAGFGKNNLDRSLSNSENQDQSMNQEMEEPEEEEEEENHDFNPEKNGDVKLTNSDVNRTPNHDESSKNKRDDSHSEMNNDNEVSHDNLEGNIQHLEFRNPDENMELDQRETLDDSGDHHEEQIENEENKENDTSMQKDTANDSDESSD